MNARPRSFDPPPFRSRLLRSELLVGTFAGLGSPAAVEVSARAGADWTLIDLEHGGGGEQQAQDSIASAIMYGMPALVRVESVDRLRAGKMLDAGASGIMFPRVQGADHAREAVSYLRYPPYGQRGAATYNRQGGFGLDPAALDRANGRVAGIVQIETKGAVAEVDAIAAVDGVDVLFVGPVDLSYAVGTPRDYVSGPYLHAVRAVVEAARHHGKTAGIMCASPASVRDAIDLGFRFLSFASDASVLASALQTLYQGAIAESATPESPILDAGHPKDDLA